MERAIDAVVPAEIFLMLVDWQPWTFPRRQIVDDTICKLLGIGIDAISRHDAITPFAAHPCFDLLREMSSCRPMATRAAPEALRETHLDLGLTGSTI